MKAFFLAIALAAGLAGPAAAGSWGYPDLRFDVQAKGRQGPGRERADPGRDSRQDRRMERQDRRMERDDRRERMSDDERRALHRDLDKANRELYRRR